MSFLKKNIGVPGSRILPLLAGLMLLLGGTSCNYTKRLPPGETLLAGYEVKVHGNGMKKGQSGSLQGELKGLLRPRPNKSFLGWRYKLFFYNLVDTPKGKGLRYFVRNKLGEPPVLASSVNMEKNRAVLENRLENDGFFYAAVTADSTTDSKKKMTTVRFEAEAGPQYKIREVHFPSDTDRLSRLIDSASKKTILKKRDPYNLNNIKDERVRIDAALKDQGYYYFSPDYLIADVDSTVGDQQVDIYISIKQSTPEYTLKPYLINNVWVYSDYTIERDSLLAEAPSEEHYGYNIIDPDHKFRSVMYPRTLVFKPGDLYSRKSHNLSLQRLVNLGTFRFVKARFEEVDTTGYFLDPYYFMTPLPRKAIRVQVTGLTRSNNATGGELNVSWRNRNTFRAAELFTVSAYAGAEQQVSGNAQVGTYRYGLDMTLTVPRIIGFFQFAKNSQFVPRTRISAGVEFFNRTSQYTLTSVRAEYGYQWKSDIRKEYRLNVLSANYVEPAHITPDFQALLDTNITIARSIQKQFILGPNFNYNFNSNAQANDRRMNYYFNLNLDVPGNILGLVTGATYNKEKKGSTLLLNVPFSQYARIELDGRNYMRLSRRNTTSILATRLLFGYGLPYGNSEQLPFIKQFFIGGANSVRAFRARSLGPGTYYARKDGNYDRFLPDQPGDIKIEGNAELRGKLVSILHGAVFVDAGNIWTQNEDPNRPGAKFTKNWFNELAVGAGVGIRLDISFLVLRLDLATPIRKPYLEGGTGWTRDFDFGSASWRRENLILNLAIGYPF